MGIGNEEKRCELMGKLDILAGRESRGADKDLKLINEVG